MSSPHPSPHVVALETEPDLLAAPLAYLEQGGVAVTVANGITPLHTLSPLDVDLVLVPEDAHRGLGSWGTLSVLFHATLADWPPLVIWGSGRPQEADRSITAWLHGDDGLRQLRMQVDIHASRRSLRQGKVDPTTEASVIHALAVSDMATLSAIADWTERMRHLGHNQQMLALLPGLLSALAGAYPLEPLADPGWRTDFLRSIRLFNIGFTLLPQSVFLAHGRLNAAEYQVVQRHCRWGSRILEEAARNHPQATWLTAAAELALTHHEHWNGGGYPQGLKGEEIPLASRISAVVDVYASLRTWRPSEAMPDREQALHFIEQQAGQLFDPRVAEVFARSYSGLNQNG